MGSCPSVCPRAPATAWTRSRGRPRARARMTSMPDICPRVHISPPVRLRHVGMSYHPPTPPSMHDTTLSTRYIVSCAISQQRIRNKSPSFLSAIAAREERCLRLKFQPHLSWWRRRAPLAVGHTTKIRRSCLVGNGKKQAHIHAVGSSSRAHSTLERSVVTSFCLCQFEQRDSHCSLVGCFFCSVVHRTRPPGRPVREVFSRPSTRATCTCRPFVTIRSNADEEHRIFILFLLRIQTDMYIHGKKTDFGAPIPLFVSFYLWLNVIPGTKIACSSVLKLVA